MSWMRWLAHVLGSCYIYAPSYALLVFPDEYIATFASHTQFGPGIDAE